MGSEWAKEKDKRQWGENKRLKDGSELKNVAKS